jgi:hypothetical protein
MDVIRWTKLETSIGAINRVKSFSENTEKEKKQASATESTSVTWLEDGRIDFIDVSVAYK